ncbi:MAG: helix-turn-helix transcriptional regulator [Propionibacteriaceae bacterium]|nr:helix-turn-helix transcriptional regulator [Propionibacteriaceae bacterium]
MLVVRGPRDVGVWLAERRRELGMTQHEVAEKARVSRQLLSRVENGSGIRTEFYKILAISKALGVEVILSNREAW